MTKTQLIYKLKHWLILRVAIYPLINLMKIIKTFNYKNSDDSTYISSLKNKYKGKRCFIVGNGPSLSMEDLDTIKNEITFGANNIYKVFNQTDWRPTFYLAFDPDFISETHRKIENIDADIKFINLVGKKHIKSNSCRFINIASKFTLKKHTTSNIKFSFNPEKEIGSGYTVTFVALQMALHLGFDEVYLIGMDHSYNKVIDSKNRVFLNDEVSNHYYKDPSNIHVGYQFLDGTNFAYQLAKQCYEANNISIYNASRGGKLEIFERVDFDDLMSRIEDTTKS